MPKCVNFYEKPCVFGTVIVSELFHFVLHPQSAAFHHIPIIMDQEEPQPQNEMQPDSQTDSLPDSTNKDEASSGRRKIAAIPISRVNAIMRSCPNLTTVKNDAIALTAKAAVRI